VTYTPTGGGNPGVHGQVGVPGPRGGVPLPARPPAAPQPQPPSGHPPRRRAWAEQSHRIRESATTEPGRLRIIGAVLALLVVAFGAVTAWQISARSTAADNVVHHSAPLSADAAEIYRSLADADATVAGGFLVGGQPPAADDKRYQADIRTAATLIAQAAANSDGSPEARAQISRLNQQLSPYTTLVATAQADNRQGLPLGGAYLRYADAQMRMPGGLLDSANKLYKTENSRLSSDYSDAKALPYASWVLGVLALAALLWMQRRNYRRTNRVFNQGLLAASAASAVVLLWLVAGHTLARAGLDDSYTHGAKSMQVLNNARIAVLQARGDENLTLVARGSGDAYQDSYAKGMVTLAGTDPKGVGGELAKALALADKTAGRTPVDTAIKNVQTWRARHTLAHTSDGNGDYTTAVAQVIGGKDGNGKTVTATTKQSFSAVDDSLAQAVAQEQKEFQKSADDGRGALSLLPLGAALLAVLAAAGALLGIGRRLSEYR
jgi:CHASE3 domain sensor protein